MVLRPNQENSTNSSHDAVLSAAPADLSLASSIAAADASLVVSETDGENIFLDDELYVTRTIEQKIIEHLNVSVGRRKPVVVIGEAGRGKTSLLWRLYSDFSRSADWQAWFIKSTMLAHSLKEDIAHHRFSAEALAGAVQASIAAGRRPLLFVDTVDLLLHDESSRDFLVALILRLDGLGCQTVLSTRPREVIRLNAFDFRRVTLLNYEGIELENAIRKHVSRFYSAAVRDDINQQVAHILESVARGLPLREVCENPLTLRMLFTIYRPAKIPPDINVFELYQQYWSYRVESDLRAGSPFSAPGGENADDCAELVALTMLAEGSPEVSTQYVKQVLQEQGFPVEHLAMLNARGVLHSSDSGLTSFFHQTFFEHSAARGLLRKLPSESLQLLRKRLQTESEDLFVTPIYEQALLLAADSTAANKNYAESALTELFASDSLSAVMSALYVYCHRRHLAKSTRLAAKTALRNSEATAKEAVHNRFLELAPNIPNSRFADLFEELNIIWETATDRTRDHLIELLSRLVPRDCDRVKVFFELRTLATWAFTQKDPSNIARKVLEVITATSFYDPAWAWKQLVDFCGTSIPRSGGRELQIQLVNFLADNAVRFGPDTIASRFERATESLTLDKARDFHELGQAIGRLWAIEWIANERSISSILSEIDATKETVRVVTRTRGLPHILFDASDEDALTALTHIEQETNQYNRSLWIDYVLPEWLELTESSTSQAIQRGFLFYYVTKVFKDETIEWMTKTLFVEAIRYTKLTATTLSILIPPTIFSSPEMWITKDRLAMIFGDAYFIDHPGPAAAVHLLTKDNPAHAVAVSKLILPSLLKRLLDSERMLDTFFEIAMEFGDVAQMLRVLEVIPTTSPRAFLKWTRPLSDHCLMVLNTSNSPQERRYAILVWEELLKRGTQPVHKLDELLSLMKSEADSRVRGPLLSIIGRSTAFMSYDLQEVFEILEPLARGPNLQLRRSAMLAIANVVTSFPGDISKYSFKALEIALSSPPDAQRLYSLRPIVERLIETNPDLAAQLSFKLIKGANESGLGTAGRHKMYGRLKRTLRLVVRGASQQRRLELVRLVPDLDRILGSLVVDSICHEALSAMAPELNNLLTRKVWGDIQEIILKYRYTQDRALGGGPWPEMSNLILRPNRLPYMTTEPGSIIIHGDNLGTIQQGRDHLTQHVTTDPRSSHSRRPANEGGRMSNQLKVLLLATNSVATVDSQCADQIRTINEAIRSASRRDEFDVQMEPALRVSGLGISLLHYPADILHISGHSDKIGGLVLEDDLAQTAKVPCEHLLEVLLNAGSNLQLVFFNFCYSADCAKKIVERVDFALGFEGQLSVTSSLLFGPAFYSALASGKSVQSAFHYGKGLLSAHGRNDGKAIVLHVRAGVDTTKSLLDSIKDPNNSTTHLRSVPGIKPPPRARVFVGRDEDVKNVRRLLSVNHQESSRRNITVVTGLPGVGKTSMVSEIGHDTETTRTFKDGVLWVSLEQNPNIISEMAKWGRALGSTEILRASTVGDATTELAKLLKDRCMLLIVDDVWETDHAAAFTEAAGEQCSVMITTRLQLVANALITAQKYPLPVLTEEFALRVLRILVPNVVEKNEAECLELVRDIQGLPLALHVAAGLLKSEAYLDWGVTELIEKIRNGTELIDSQAPNDRIGKDGVIPSVSSLLHRSTDVLDEATRAGFISLGTFAPKPETFDLEALQAVCELDDPKPLVRKLVDHGLLEPVGEARFQMHRILVDHARKRMYARRRSKT